MNGLAARSVAFFAAAACLAIYVASIATVGLPTKPWAGPSMFAPIGHDEFGRNIAATLITSSMHSILYAAVAVLLAGAISIFVALGVSSYRKPFFASLLDGLTYVIEGIPVLLWVVALAVLAPTAGRTAGLIIFVLATLPFLTKLAAGELCRIHDSEFMAVARSLELPVWRQLKDHILPNAMSVLAPALAQTFGLAIAVDGAIAIAGSVNRSELSLGVMLIRGKENFIAYPHLLLWTLATVVIIYGLVAFAIRHFAARSGEQQA
jgi:peptide/nickel transport system permease protein